MINASLSWDDNKDALDFKLELWETQGSLSDISIIQNPYLMQRASCPLNVRE